MKTTTTKILISVKESRDCKNDLGITLPDPLAMYNLEQAKVLCVGDEVKGVSPSDEIYIQKGAGFKFKDPETGEERRVITVTDIIAIL